MEKKKETYSGKDPVLSEDHGAPDVIDPKTGKHKDYWVLSEEERKKEFVRPLRDTYIHVGRKPKFPLRDLTEEEKKRFGGNGYVKYEEYPKGDTCLGRFWIEEDLKGVCGVVTKMGQKLAETYARDPKFYGSTFCCGCKKHLPVEEFLWDGTDEKVGS